MSKWVKGTVTGNLCWTDRLHSLQVDAAEVTFVGNTFDPRVIYDHASERWFAVAVDNAGQPNNILVAVSNSCPPGWV